MPKETIGDVEHVITANHPPRKDSPEYKKSRVWLMGMTQGGCYVCDGPVDMSHPQAPCDPTGQQDHHSGALYLYPDGGGDPVLVGYNLFGTEWSLGFAAEPARVAAHVKLLNEVTKRLGGPSYDLDIATTADVMAYVDSTANANLKLCANHHVAHETQDTLDARGFQAVGVHCGPFPIWLGQVTCAFAEFDMWGGSTGTIAVSKISGSKSVRVEYVSPLHADTALYDAHRDAQTTGHVVELSASHPHARLAHSGAHVAA